MATFSSILPLRALAADDSRVSGLNTAFMMSRVAVTCWSLALWY